MLNDVDLIYSVLPGETINIETRTTDIHNSYYTAVNRWWYAESRIGLIKWIAGVINIETNKPKTRKQRENIDKLIHGIRNLAYTYVGSEIAKSLMDQVKYLEEFIKTPPLNIIKPNNNLIKHSI